MDGYEQSEIGSPRAHLSKTMLPKKIIFVAPFPPPIGGAAKNTRIIADELESKKMSILKLDTSSPHLHRRNLKYHVSRVKKFLGNMLAISLMERGAYEKAYVVPDGGLGAFYTLVYILMLRFRRCKIVLHHRGYEYVTNYVSVVMAIVRAAGAGAVHVFLDEKMAERFGEKYGRSIKYMVVGNAATSDIAGSSFGNMPSDRPVTVGHLSNLSYDKGFDVVCKVFLLLAQRSGDFQFRLGGDPVGESESRLLQDLTERLGCRLEYLGAVYGPAKQQFYDGLDVFVFPTRFPQEAQPNVVFEAMAVGAFVLATDRGCIPEMLKGAPSAILEDSPQLAEMIVEEICRIADDLKARTHVSLIRANFAELQLMHRAQYRNLIKVLCE